MIYIFQERKQVGLLHHFTEVENLGGILGNSLHLKSGLGYVSFTRNWRLGDESKDFQRTNVRLTFFGDLLSDRYKIEPFYDVVNLSTTGSLRQQGRHEAEERITEPSITVDPKYLAGVQFKFPKFLDVAEEIGRDEAWKLKEWLEDNDIPYAFSPKWVPPKSIG